MAQRTHGGWEASRLRMSLRRCVNCTISIVKIDRTNIANSRLPVPTKKCLEEGTSVAMCFITYIASERVLERKNIHAKQTKAKVKTIWKVLWIAEWAPTPSCETRFARAFFVAIPVKRYTPFSAPQMMNVQFAPCQRPLIKKVTKILKHHRLVDTSFPPIGIYK